MMSPFYMVNKARIKALKDIGGQTTDNGAGKKRASNGDDAEGGKKARRSNEGDAESEDDPDADPDDNADDQ